MQTEKNDAINHRKVGEVMTKQDILDRFRDINEAYNDSSRYDSLSRMLDELLKEQEPKMVQSIRTVAYRTLGYCPSCGRGLDSYHDGNSGEHITHFCYNCGQAVKWG